MRIAMLLESVYPPDIRVEKEVRALINGGHQVYVLCYTAEDQPERQTVDGGKVVRKPIQEAHNGISGWKNGLKYLISYVHQGWAQEAQNLIESQNIDAIHAHDLPVVKTAIMLGNQYDIPVVADLHENWPEAKRYYRKGTDWGSFISNPKLILARVLKSYRRLKRFEKYSVQHADRVLTVVEEGKKHYVEDCGAQPELVNVISNVVDLRMFDDFEVRSLGYEDEFVISYVGTMTGEHRGLDTVIEAMPTVTEHVEDVRLLLVGPESWYTQDLDDLSKKINVKEQVTFTGRVPFEDVPSYLAASDVCTVPHQKNPHTETTVPHKLFQYMAMRKPVIGTDVTPVSRIIRDANAGLIVPSMDQDAMADAIMNLEQHPEKRTDFGYNGRKAVEDRYNWEIEGEKLRRFYQDIFTDSL